MNKFLLTLIFLFTFPQCHSQDENGTKFTLTKEETIFLDSLQYRTFLYFINESTYANGMVKDRSTKDSPSSIAAVGFGIAAWAIGSEREWITRKEAAERTLNLLKFLLSSEQSTDELATGYKGFYYHFLDMKTGKRYWASELSSIDTALLLAGIIFARQFYNEDNPIEKDIRELSSKIIERVNWDFYLIPSNKKYSSLVSMGWKPDDGLLDYGWFGYNEALILYVIAAGSGMNHSEQAYSKWLETYKWMEPYPGLAHVVFPPLFGHQFSHMFIDFRGIADSYMKKKRIDYFENSRRATLTQRIYTIDNPLRWKGYDSLTWGLTACDGPGSKYNYDNKKFIDYAARGTSGPDLVHDDDGTIAPTASAGSIVFVPEAVIPTLMKMKERYGDKGLWGTYGFYDAFNPTINWFDSDYLGIDQGPIVIMIENLRSGLVWNYFMKDPIIQKGLKKLGFEKLTE